MGFWNKLGFVIMLFAIVQKNEDDDPNLGCLIFLIFAMGGVVIYNLMWVLARPGGCA
jgi:hypothetical protein